jgi:O-antigen/teichoic acid export membrane protein
MLRSPRSQIKARYAKGLVWAGGAAIISQLGMYACAVVGARILGREVYGQFAAVQSVVLACAQVATTGLGITATKYVAEYRQSDTAKVGRILGLCFRVTAVFGGGVGLITFAAADIIAGLAFRTPELAPAIKAAAFYIPFFAMNAYQVGTLVGLEAFRSLFVASVLQSTAAIGVTLMLTAALGLVGASAALSAGAAISWVVHQVFLTRQCSTYGIRKLSGDCWGERAILTEFALPAVLASSVGAAVVWSSSVLLTRQSRGFVDMALYNAANLLRNVVLYLPGLGAKVVAPMLCNLKGLSKTEQYVRVWWGNTLASALAAVIAAVLLSAASPVLLQMFGREFRGGELVCFLLFASGVLEVLSVAYYQVILSHGKMWWQSGVVTIWAAVWLALAFLLVPPLGAVGLAICSLGAWTIALGLYIALARRLLVASEFRNEPSEPISLEAL